MRRNLQSPFPRKSNYRLVRTLRAYLRRMMPFVLCMCRCGWWRSPLRRHDCGEAFDRWCGCMCSVRKATPRTCLAYLLSSSQRPSFGSCEHMYERLQQRGTDTEQSTGRMTSRNTDIQHSIIASYITNPPAHPPLLARAMPPCTPQNTHTQVHEYVQQQHRCVAHIQPISPSPAPTRNCTRFYA